MKFVYPFIHPIFWFIPQGSALLQPAQLPPPRHHLPPPQCLLQGEALCLVETRQEVEALQLLDRALLPVKQKHLDLELLPAAAVEQVNLVFLALKRIVNQFFNMQFFQQFQLSHFS